ncbi:hypothetical protein D9M68_382680 [compost metagenome]
MLPPCRRAHAAMHGPHADKVAGQWALELLPGERELTFSHDIDGCQLRLVDGPANAGKKPYDNLGHAVHICRDAR